MVVAASSVERLKTIALQRYSEITVFYTHYDYLELAPGASTSRIEAAYRTLKQRLDSNGDELMVRLIHEAYAVLSDAEQRHVYDDSLQRAAAEADAELKACLDQKSGARSRYVQDVPAPLVAAIRAWAA